MKLALKIEYFKEPIRPCLKELSRLLVIFIKTNDLRDLPFLIIFFINFGRKVTNFRIIENKLV